MIVEEEDYEENDSGQKAKLKACPHLVFVSEVLLYMQCSQGLLTILRVIVRGLPAQ